jgi:hypothetical protein
VFNKTQNIESDFDRVLKHLPTDKWCIAVLFGL